MSTGQQIGLIGNSIKVQSLPTASAETFGAGNRFYTLIGQQEGYITGHTYRTVMANDVYSWEDVAYGNYNMLDNIPVINQDLTSSGFTPVNGTYYRHTGTTNTYTQGVIYYYDGTEYKALDGSGGGGISDVKVNGISVVTDGVANIPPASTSKNGVVTTGAQSIVGSKTFYSNVQIGASGYSPTLKLWGAPLAMRSPYANSIVYLANDGSSQDFARLYTYGERASTEIRYQLNGYGLGKGTSTSQCYLEINPYQKNCLVRTHDTYGTSVAMFAPSTWSSGTSGSITLTESGTYQIKSNLGDAIVVYDGTRQVQSAIILADSSNLYYYHISAEGVLKVSYVGKNDSTSGSSTNYEIKYRKIGIA